jgi:site-specific DNA recombinase
MLSTHFKQNDAKDKAVLYLRYSSDSQTENSIEGQRRECLAFAKSKGIDVLGEYVDRAKTGMSDDRPDFQRLIRDSVSKSFGNVIVWKSDRFARDKADAVNYRRKLMDSGVKLISVTEPSIDGPLGTLMDSVTEGMNQYYSEELSVKVKRGIRENVLNGKTIGGVSQFGYRFDAGGHYEIDPVEGPIVQEVFRLYGDEGKSMFAITRILKERGLLRSDGSPITHSTVERCLLSERYVGVLKCDGASNDKAIPALVDKALFERCQDRRKKRKHCSYRQGDGAAYWLTGKVFCAKCGGEYRGESGTSMTGRVYSYYKCSGAKSHKCDAKPIPKDFLERKVCQAVLAIVSDSRFAGPIAAAIYSQQSKETPESLSMKKRLGEVNIAINNFLKAIGMGIVTESTKSELIKLEAERKDLEKHIDELSFGSPKFSKEQIEMAMRMLASRSIDSERERRALLDSFVGRVIIEENGDIKLESDLFGYLPTEAEQALLELKVRISDRLPRQQIRMPEKSGIFCF